MAQDTLHRRLICTLISAAACAISIATPVNAQEVIKVTMASGQPAVFLWVKHLNQTFIPVVNAELAKAGRYKVAWNEAYGGTLAKGGSELETMQHGISDAGAVVTAFHSSKMPLNNLTYVVPYGPTDANVVMKAMDSVQRLPELTAEWNKYNLMYLGGFAIDDFNLVTRFPVNAMKDLIGKKLGAGGNNLAWLRNTGAVGVQGNIVDHYNNAKTGVADGAIGFLTSAVPAKLYEVMPYFTEVNMGSMYVGAVAVNRDRWSKFPEEVKDAFRKAGIAWQVAYHAEQGKQLEAALGAWTQGGGRIAKLTPAERLKLINAMPNLASIWINQAGGAPAKKVLGVYMEQIRATGFKFLRDFDKE